MRKKNRNIILYFYYYHRRRRRGGGMYYGFETSDYYVRRLIGKHRQTLLLEAHFFSLFRQTDYKNAVLININIPSPFTLNRHQSQESPTRGEAMTTIILIIITYRDKILQLFI